MGYVGLGKKLIWAMLLGGMLSLSTAVWAGPVNAEDRDNLQEITLALLDTQHIEIAFQAIEHLGDYKKYQDADDIVLSLIEIELSNGKRPKVLIALLDALGQVGYRKTVLNKDFKKVTRFVELRTKIIESYVAGQEKYRNKGIPELLKEITEVMKKDTATRSKGKLFTRTDITDKDNLLNEALAYREKLEKAAAKEASKEPEDFYKSSKYKPFQAELLSRVGKDYETKEIKAGDATAFEIVLAGTTDFITDQVIEDYREDKLITVIGRDEEIRKTVITLSNDQQNNAVYTGSAGAGKTTVAIGVAQYLVFANVEENPVTAFLKDAVMIQTSAGRLSRLAKTDKDSGQAFAMETYLKALAELQETLGRRIVLFIDEIHTLSNAQVEAMKPFMDSKSSKLLFLGASTSREFQNAFKANEAFLRRITFIGVENYSDEMIQTILRNMYLPYLEKLRPGLSIDDKTLMFVVQNAIYAFPEKGKIAASQRLLDSLSNELLFANPSNKLLITENEVVDYIQEMTKLPVDTRDFKAMAAYRKDLIEKIKQDVKGQDRMITDIVDAWMEVLTDDSDRGVRIVLSMGRSGTGKTEVAKSFARHALGGEDHFLHTEANQYGDTNGIGMSVLMGVPGGVSYGKETSGVLMDFLDDRGHGYYKGLWLIDEAEKANLLFYETLMRFFDEGKAEGGDGRVRIARRHLVVLTSNAHDKVIFPDEVRNWTLEQIESRLDEFNERTLRTMLDKIFPDTVVNRIDKITLANIIVREVAEQIAEMVYESQRRRFEKLAGVKLEFDKSFTEQFLETYNPMDRGARDLVRFLKQHINTGVRNFLGEVEYSKDDVISLRVEGEGRPQVVIQSSKGKDSYEFKDAIGEISCSKSASK